jgi:hypothetical protein
MRMNHDPSYKVCSVTRTNGDTILIASEGRDLYEIDYLLGIGKVGVVDKPVPDPGPNDAVIKTTAS